MAFEPRFNSSILYQFLPAGTHYFINWSIWIENPAILEETPKHFPPGARVFRCGMTEALIVDTYIIPLTPQRVFSVTDYMKYYAYFYNFNYIN